MAKMFSFKEMPQSASSLFSAYASFATSMMMIRSLTHELLPPQFKSFLSAIFRYLFGRISSQTTFVFDEYTGQAKNEAYEVVDTYLRSKISPSTQRVKVRKTSKHKKFTFSIDKNQKIIDHFDNIQLKWRFVCTKQEQATKSVESLSFELAFDMKFRDKIVDFYLPLILRRANEINESDKANKIYSQECRGNWGSINQDHPATFETVAMDPELKKLIMDDLDRFVRRKNFYKKVGKAWKRGYLLYGPPGTGKSSLIAAIANYLNFDIYDLDLTNIYSNSDLRKVLLSTSNRSILVIEDIDCSVDIQNRKTDEKFDRPKQRFTLSGMLNFIDGLWSSCGDERIIIFTTNHKDRLDPALLRPGRMDFHIHMSYCTTRAFKILACNYLGDDVADHRLYKEVEGLIQNMEVTPAEVAEQLMKSDDVDITLNGLANFLKHKKQKQSEVGDKETSYKKSQKKEETDETFKKPEEQNASLELEDEEKVWKLKHGEKKIGF